MTSVAVGPETYDDVGRIPLWPFVISGVVWVLISLAVLSFDSTSVTTIAIMVGIVLVVAGAGELMAMALAPGWRWLHGVLGVLFIAGGVGAMLDPFQTLGILALFVGWFLLIKGFFDIALAIGARRALPMWGLMLAVGIGEIILGLWAIGYPGRSAALVVLWVGVAAMLRGIGDLVLAFTIGDGR